MNREQFTSLDSFLNELTKCLAVNGSHDNRVTELLETASDKPVWSELAKTAVTLRRAFEEEEIGDQERENNAVPEVDTHTVAAVESGTAVRKRKKRNSRWMKWVPLFGTFLAILVGVMVLGKTWHSTTLVPHDDGIVAMPSGGSVEVAVSHPSEGDRPRPMHVNNVFVAKTSADNSVAVLATASDEHQTSWQDSLSGEGRFGVVSVRGASPDPIPLFFGVQGSVIPLPTTEDGRIDEVGWDVFFKEIQQLNARIRNAEPITIDQVSKQLAPIYDKAKSIAKQRGDLIDYDLERVVANDSTILLKHGAPLIKRGARASDSGSASNYVRWQSAEALDLKDDLFDATGELVAPGASDAR